MGFGSDIISNVITRYKADTSDQRKEIKKLRGAQKKQAEESLKQLEKQNEKLDSHIATWGKVAGAIGGVTLAIGAAKVGFEAFEKDQRLRMASAGISITKLQQATNGLVTEQKLLELAAAGANSTFAAGQKDLETAARFMLVLRDRGVDLETAFEKVKQAVTEANTEGFKEIGLNWKIDTETAHGFSQMIDRMGDSIEKTGKKFTRYGDDIRKAMVETKDAARKLEVAWGQAVAEAEHQGLRGLYGIGHGIDALTFGMMGKAARARGAAKATAEASAMIDRLLAKDDAAMAALDKRFAQIRARQSWWGDVAGDLISQGKAAGERYKNRPGGGGGLSGADAAVIRGAASSFARDVQATLRSASKIVSSATLRGNSPLGQLLPGPGGLPQPHLAQTDMPASALSLGNIDTAKAHREEMDKLFSSIVDGSQVAQGAFTNAFAAMVDGTKSFKEAMKDAVGNTLSGMSVRMFSRALMEGAEAVASLAIGDFAGAANHGIAAGLFGAGAVAAGAAARAWGGHGAPSHAPSGAAAGAAVGASRPQLVSPGEGSREIVYVIADQSRGDRYRAETFARGQRAYHRRGGAVQGVVKYA